jgi:hypothetical protein
MDGCRAIDHLACLVVVAKGVTNEVDVIEIEMRIVYNMYRMRQFTTITVCAGCCLWALPTIPYRKLTSQG